MTAHLSDDSTPLILGAVAYDARVVTIWDGFQQYFLGRGLPFDYVLYSNYERQVEAQLLGHVHVAWNSPLGWLQTQRVAERIGRRADAICMRDTDRDLRSLIIASSGSGIASVEDLKGKIVAVGARDSPQATLIPLHYLAAQGLSPGQDFEVRVFDVLVGKHGDHVGGERDAVRAVLRGEADAACIIDSNHLAFAREGTIPASSTRVLAQTPAYDHCNFTVLDGVRVEQVAQFRDLLLNMSYADAEVRPLLDLEGLKQWLPGRVSGYGELAAAIERFGTIEPFVARLQAVCA